MRSSPSAQTPGIIHWMMMMMMQAHQPDECKLNILSTREEPVDKRGPGYRSRSRCWFKKGKTRPGKPASIERHAVKGLCHNIVPRKHELICTRIFYEQRRSFPLVQISAGSWHRMGWWGGRTLFMQLFVVREKQHILLRNETTATDGVVRVLLTTSVDYQRYPASSDSYCPSMCIKMCIH